MRKILIGLVLCTSAFANAPTKQFTANGRDFWRWLTEDNYNQRCHLNNGEDFLCRYITEEDVIEDGHCDGARESARDLAMQACRDEGFQNCTVVNPGEQEVYVMRVSEEGFNLSTGCDVHGLVVEGN
jgi:hypothetical protein